MELGKFERNIIYSGTSILKEGIKFLNCLNQIVLTSNNGFLMFIFNDETPFGYSVWFFFLVIRIHQLFKYYNVNYFNWRFKKYTRKDISKRRSSHSVLWVNRLEFVLKLKHPARDRNQNLDWREFLMKFP